MLPLKALPLEVPSAVTTLVSILTSMVLELGVLGVIHIVLIILHDLQINVCHAENTEPAEAFVLRIGSGG